MDVCSVKVHAKTTMLGLLPENCDILCTHPMFGPESGKNGWGGLNFVYERVRCKAKEKTEDHLRWWGQQGCRMLDMTCELHDELAAGSQFVTHFTGRMLDRIGMRSTPINTKGFETCWRWWKPRVRTALTSSRPCTSSTRTPRSSSRR